MDVIIRRIETANPKLNLMATPAYDRAREKAESIPRDTLFAGVPILMKDMIDVGGIYRTDGSRLNSANMPEKNVAYVDAVESAGLNILVMTNVPEFASCVVTANDLFGAIHNPWDINYSAFASSGGAAVAVAGGVLPMTHGTDGGGSSRLPASTTGILGMKPSRFRMLSGEADGGHDLIKTNQTLSRTVRDSAMLLSLTEDRSGMVYEPVGLVQGSSKKRLRVGYVADMPGLCDVELAVKAAQDRSANLLQQLGHTLSETTIPLDME